MGCRLEGVYRQDIYELPPDSIRELIVNAIMNCSYIQASNIQVAIYDDRLEITSPGGLLPGVTIDLMKEGFSKIRNRSLANAFAYMNLVEAWGSGIPKLMQAMQEYGLREPEFIDMEVALRINLYRGQKEIIEVNEPKNEINEPNNEVNEPKNEINEPNNEVNEPKNEINEPNNEVNEPKNEINEPNNEVDEPKNEINEPNNEFNKPQKDDDAQKNNIVECEDNLEIRVLKVIYQNPEVTQKALGETLSVSVSTIKRILAKMQREGKVIREGSKRKGKWVLIKEK